MPRRQLMRRIGFVAGILTFQILWLGLVGRNFLGPEGIWPLWQTRFEPAQNSKQFADWYSLLHVIFGMGIFVSLARFCPRWSLQYRALITLISSTVWEVIENAPWIIAIINASTQGPSYGGDSIINSLADTLFALCGFMLARWLPGWVLLLLAVVLETVVSLMINDGLLLGTLRLMGLGYR